MFNVRLFVFCFFYSNARSLKQMQCYYESLQVSILATVATYVLTSIFLIEWTGIEVDYPAVEIYTFIVANTNYSLY